MEYTKAVAEQLEQEQKAEATHQEEVQKQQLLLYHLKHEKTVKEAQDADIKVSFDKL